MSHACIDCGEADPAAFYRRSNGGLQSRCKRCHNAYCIAYSRSAAGKEVMKRSAMRGTAEEAPPLIAERPLVAAVRYRQLRAASLFFPVRAWRAIGAPTRMDIERFDGRTIDLRAGSAYAVSVPRGGQPRLAVGRPILAALGIVMARYPLSISGDRLRMAAPVPREGVIPYTQLVPTLHVRLMVGFERGRGEILLNARSYDALERPNMLAVAYDVVERIIALRVATNGDPGALRLRQERTHQHTTVWLTYAKAVVSHLPLSAEGTRWYEAILQDAQLLVALE